jgi:hypothetical protein
MNAHIINRFPSLSAGLSPSDSAAKLRSSTNWQPGSRTGRGLGHSVQSHGALPTTTPAGEKISPAGTAIQVTSKPRSRAAPVPACVRVYSTGSPSATGIMMCS